MDNKGKLFEYCREHGLPEPVFGLEVKKGGCHNPLYLSYVQVGDEVYIGEFVKSRIKDSEKEAARVFFITLSEDEKAELPSPRSTRGEEELFSKRYYIDLEGCAGYTLPSASSSSIEVVKVCSIGAAKSIRDQCDVVVNCTRSNAADVAIIALLTEDMISPAHENSLQFAIVSRDKLLHTFAEVAEKLYGVSIEIIIP